MLDLIPSSEVLTEPRRPRGRLRQRCYLCAKRLLDVAVAAGLLLLLAPVFALVAVVIRRDSPGPVFFRQTRVGRHGRPFTMYKFRSMRSGANEAVHREYFLGLLVAEGAGEAPAVFKVPNDRRVTRVGRILRKTSVDELPQLWNVLRGEMSLVGPRPPIPYEVEAYEPWMRRRLDVQPGITGLWQVCGRSRLTVTEMFRLDIDYVERQSFRLDLRILLLTIPTVLSPKQAA
ncbi:MAG TPA: sugar transferase [Thermomicrobiales bacterium]|nr:sugar transferase [Thermomicrobiales bacterium]